MLVMLFTVPPFLNLIGLERYGMLAIIWVLLGYFGFFDFGFGRAVAQRMATLKYATDHERSSLLWTALISTFLLGIVASLALLLSVDHLLMHFIDIGTDNYNEIYKSIFWLILALPILLPSSVLQGALQGRELFISLNVINIIGSTLSQILPLIVAWNGYTSLEFLIPTVLIARIVSVVLTFTVCRTDKSLLGSAQIDMNHLTPLVSYGGWISIISILAPILITIDKLVIAGMSGAKTVTFYAIPYSLVSKVLVVPGSLSSAIFPRFAYADNKESSIAENATKILITVMTPIVMIGILFINPFLGIWIDEQFSMASKGIGELLLLGIWINSIVYVYHANILATRSPRILAVLYLFEIPVYIFLLWFGLELFGVIGAAGAWALRTFMDTTFILYMSNAVIKTVHHILVPIGFLLSTILVIVFFGDDFVIRFSFGVLLVSIFVVYERKQVGALYNNLKLYRERT